MLEIVGKFSISEYKVCAQMQRLGFQFPICIYVSVYLPVMMKRSLVAKHHLFSETVFLRVLLHFDTEIHTLSFAVMD